MMPPRHVYPKLCHLFFSKSVLEPVQQPPKLPVHITHLLVINSKGQMPVCHTSSSPIHVINLCMTSLYIFIALAFQLPYSTYTYRWATCMSSSRFQSQVFFMDATIHSSGQRESLSQLSNPVPHDGDSSKLKRHKSGIACPSMLFIRLCAPKTQPCFMNSRPFVSCTESGIPFTMG